MDNSIGDSDGNYSHELSSNEDDRDEEGSENGSEHNKAFKLLDSPQNEGAVIY